MRAWQCLRSLIACVAVTWASPVSAMDVYFGGFAFLGDYQAADKNYPYSMVLAKPGAGVPSILDRALQQKLAGFDNASFTLVRDQLGTLDANSKSAIAMGLALDNETVSIEKLSDDTYKALVLLSAQAMFFDFKEKVVIATFPVGFRYNHVYSHAPSREELQALIQKVYFGEIAEGNFIDTIVTTLRTFTLNTAVKRRVQVTEVTIADEARAMLPESMAANEASLRAAIGQEMGRWLYENQRVPVLPYATGHAIGNRMAARFADGQSFNLTIPEPDYVIRLRLTELRRKEFGTAAAGTSFVYGAFLDVKVLEPLSNKTYFDATIKNGVTKLVTSGQENVDHWPTYQEALLSLMDKFTFALSHPTREWAERHTGNKAIGADLKNLHQVLQSCK